MPSNKRNIMSTELGVTGLSRFGGQITEEYLPELRGDRGRRTLKQMASTDPTIGALLFALKQMVRAAEWEVREPYKDDSRIGKKAADFIQECLDDMNVPFESTISGICSMFTYGWDLREICLKVRNGMNVPPGTPKSKHNDGMIGINKLAPRSQLTLDHWEFNNDGSVSAMIQRDPDTGRLYRIPMTKALLFRTEDDKDNPEGRAVIANAYSAYYFCKNIKEIEGIGVERDLAGLPVLRIPAEIFVDKDKTTQLQDAKNLVVNVRRDEQEGVLLPYNASNPEAYKLELLGSPGQRQFDTDKIIERYKTEIAQCVLADFILLGHSNVGSYALSRTKGDMFGIAVGGYLDAIAGVFNSDLIPSLLQINPYYDGINKYPYIVPRIPVLPTLDELNGLIRSLAFAGLKVTTDLELINTILDKFALPALTEENIERERKAEEGKEKSSIERMNDAQKPVGEEDAKDNAEDQ